MWSVDCIFAEIAQGKPFFLPTLSICKKKNIHGVFSIIMAKRFRYYSNQPQFDGRDHPDGQTQYAQVERSVKSTRNSLANTYA